MAKEKNSELSELLSRYQFVILGVVAVTVFVYRVYNYYNKLRITELKDIINIPRDKDYAKFTETMRDECLKDDCLLAYSLVKQGINRIEKEGLKEFLRELNFDQDVFKTGSGDYIFIYKENEDKVEKWRGNNYAIYGGTAITDKKFVDESQESLDEVCGVGKCSLHTSMKRMVEFTEDNELGGFVDYYWFDIETNDVIVKRSYIQRVKDIEYEGKKINIYIGSGFTLKFEDENQSIIGVIIQFLNIVLFGVFFWYFNMSNLIDNKIIMSAFFYFVVLFQVLYLNYVTTSTSTLDESIKHLDEITATSTTLVFISLIITIHFGVIKKLDLLAIELFILGFIFAILSTLRYSQNTNMDEVQTILHTKMAFNMNSVILFAMVYIKLLFK